MAPVKVQIKFLTALYENFNYPSVCFMLSSLFEFNY